MNEQDMRAVIEEGTLISKTVDHIVPWSQTIKFMCNSANSQEHLSELLGKSFSQTIEDNGVRYEEIHEDLLYTCVVFHRPQHYYGLIKFRKKFMEGMFLGFSALITPDGIIFEDNHGHDRNLLTTNLKNESEKLLRLTGDPR